MKSANHFVVSLIDSQELSVLIQQSMYHLKTYNCDDLRSNGISSAALFMLMIILSIFKNGNH